MKTDPVESLQAPHKGSPCPSREEGSTDPKTTQATTTQTGLRPPPRPGRHVAGENLESKPAFSRNHWTTSKVPVLPVLQLQLTMGHCVGAFLLGQLWKSIYLEAILQTVSRKTYKEWQAFLCLLCLPPHSLDGDRISPGSCPVLIISLCRSLIC